MTVRIVTDSSADLPQNLIDQHQITVLPCYVVVDDQTYKDGIEIQADAFYARLKAILRKHCAARFHLPAEVRTSEELLRALPKALPTLQPCLMTCDVVLFGGAAADDSRQDPATRDGARDHAIQFVESTQVGAHVVEVSA